MQRKSENPASGQRTGFAWGAKFGDFLRLLHYYLEGRRFEWLITIAMLWLAVAMFVSPQILRASAFQWITLVISPWFTILHISDMHVDMNEAAMQRLIELVGDMRYDLCVLTGDYRGKNLGPFEATLNGVARVRAHLKEPVYGVLGDHDTIQMVPGLEAMGIHILLNESQVIARGDQQIYLAGIDDAHCFKADDIKKAALQIPFGKFSILLSHTPEVYHPAAHAGFKLLLSGHTHGGQICLPGFIPIILDAVLPRRMGAGAWRYHDMVGYTSVGAGSSVVPVRLNCPPEVTLHCLRSG